MTLLMECTSPSAFGSSPEAVISQVVSSGAVSGSTDAGGRGLMANKMPVSVSVRSASSVGPSAQLQSEPRPSFLLAQGGDGQEGDSQLNAVLSGLREKTASNFYEKFSQVFELEEKKKRIEELFAQEKYTEMMKEIKVLANLGDGKELSQSPLFYFRDIANSYFQYVFWNSGPFEAFKFDVEEAVDHGRSATEFLTSPVTYWGLDRLENPEVSKENVAKFVEQKAYGATLFTNSDRFLRKFFSDFPPDVMEKAQKYFAASRK
uniref:Uncharacterized protein n=1 Tax=Chromera velia CCMP2878 TaxID=1169474 RepID=A0A0G4H9R0_9ALVE|eukprot:Cvel_25487.t1-p1 / transcript=Cvel_25487.t1 / gene=Cvel_25487 / organism=Chromera_velia_CCMP2878 / gene_product=hypothetical protein / transcript_product=hypothetical protein / location=Cvel_scaffold2895:6878-7660(+) / protein_length=261 / sequence_SO=supercontig / SO=protein_coding / is_pseudo=false